MPESPNTSRHPGFPSHWKRVESAGFGRFVSRLVFRLPDGTTRVWESRRHRKHRTDRGGVLWAPRSIGWWIAVLFSIGSLLFAVGSLAGLGPSVPRGTSLIFFVGSIVFTLAAYLQLLETINADRKTDPTLGFRWFAWRPRRIGWLASFVQLVGTILFNVNTLDAFVPGVGWLPEDLRVWAPDILGSVCFMVASQLAVQELCHGLWCWRPRSLSWWVVLVNWVGSVAFLVSAVLAFVRPGDGGPVDAWWATVTTFVGAVCFLVGALLLFPETAPDDVSSGNS